jgi:4'-phosphopantetheinyl transferase
VSSDSRAPLATLAAIDTVQIWLVDTEAPAPVLAALESLLDDDERRRVAALRSPRLRRQFIAAHGAVRVIVGGCLAAPPEQIRWRRGEHGKPELAGAWTGRQVNLSHSGGLVLVAVSERRPVGVDIQHSPPRLDPARFAARFYPAPEARSVASAGEPADRADQFVRLWTRKEACVKAAGGRLMQGMALPVTDPLVHDPTGALPGHYRVRDVPAPRGFHAAVALAGAQPFQVTQHTYTHSPARV